LLGKKDKFPKGIQAADPTCCGIFHIFPAFKNILRTRIKFTTFSFWFLLFLLRLIATQLGLIFKKIIELLMCIKYCSLFIGPLRIVKLKIPTVQNFI